MFFIPPDQMPEEHIVISANTDCIPSLILNEIQNDRWHEKSLIKWNARHTTPDEINVPSSTKYNQLNWSLDFITSKIYKYKILEQKKHLKEQNTLTWNEQKE